MQHRSALAVVLAAIIGSGVGACGTSGGMSDAKKQDKEMAAETAKGFESIDDARCRSFGYQPGSPSYAHCRDDYKKLHAQGSGE
jgi:hypothetical protein